MSIREKAAAVFEEARDDVYRYLLTFKLPPAEAQDASQEVFLRLYMAMKKGEEIRNPRAWVFRVAHNLALNMTSRKGEWQPFGPELEATLKHPQVPADRGLMERERRARLSEALEALSPQQRRCLYLRAEGLRYHEIAEAVGVKASTVGEFLSRAITRLRKAVHG